MHCVRSLSWPLFFLSLLTFTSAQATEQPAIPEVECHATFEGQAGSRDKLAWLQDLNVFVPVTQQIGDKPESQVKQESVNVIR